MASHHFNNIVDVSATRYGFQQYNNMLPGFHHAGPQQTKSQVPHLQQPVPQDFYYAYPPHIRRDQLSATYTKQHQTTTPAMCPYAVYQHPNFSPMNFHGQSFHGMNPNMPASEPLFGVPPTFALQSLHALASQGSMTSQNSKPSQKKDHPFHWRRLHSSTPLEGMTRTKDKYRVVYTEKQKIGLEKAFKDHKFITTKQRADLTKELDLSERQIKIWFQNRRAKERRTSAKVKTVTNNDDNTDITEDKREELPESLPSCRFAGESEIKPEYSQCRYQGSPSVGNVGMLHQAGTDGTLFQHPSSPTEWNTWSSENLMTSLNISPLMTNTDFSSYPRS